MTLNKQKMVREIGQRTRLTNREVQEVIEALVDVWTEELIAGGRIEIQNFLVLETKIIDRGEHRGMLNNGEVPSIFRQVNLRVGKRFKRKLQESKKSVSEL